MVLIIIIDSSCYSLIEIEVGEVFGRGHGLGHLVVIEDDPLPLLLDVTYVMAAHGGCAHVTDERH